MFDFEKELALSEKARELYERLCGETSMGNIADVIADMDEDTAKRVLKMFVYAQ